MFDCNLLVTSPIIDIWAWSSTWKKRIEQWSKSCWLLTVIEHWGWVWQIFSLLIDSYRYTTPCINSTVRTILINWNPNKLVRWRAKVSEQRQPVQFCVSGDQHSFSLEKRLGSLGIGTKLVSPLTHFTVLYMTCPSRTVVIFILYYFAHMYKIFKPLTRQCHEA